MIELHEKGSVFSYLADSVINLRFVRPDLDLPAISRLYRRPDYESDSTFEAAIESEVADKNGKGYNCYQCLNTINYDFRGVAVTDSDIFAAEYLFIDVDRVGKKKSPASDSELQKAWCLTSKIVDYLTAQDWPPPTIVMSGNGYHIYYAIDDDDLNPTADNKLLKRAVVGCLAKMFDSSSYQSDQGVYNESRLVKVIGTIAYKGEDSPFRPYRRASLVSRCSNSYFVTNDMMRELISTLGFDPDAEIQAFNSFTGQTAREPETPRKVAQVVDALGYVDADCHYDTWHRIVWAVMSTGWACAEDIARDWSASAPDRYEELAFMLRVNSFNPDHEKQISLGTLFHHAKLGGWNG